MFSYQGTWYACDLQKGSSRPSVSTLVSLDLCDRTLPHRVFVVIGDSMTAAVAILVAAVLTAPQHDWAPYTLQLKSEPLGPNKPSSLNSDLLGSIQALMPPADPRGSDQLDSSAPTKTLSPSQKFTGRPLPGPGMFTAPYQGLPGVQSLPGS